MRLLHPIVPGLRLSSCLLHVAGAGAGKQERGANMVKFLPFMWEGQPKHWALGFILNAVIVAITIIWTKEY